MPVLSINNLSKIYPGGQLALRDLTLTIEPGVFGLLGLNGAGKSTLLKILAASLDCEEGSASIDSLSPRKNPMEWRRRISYMPQSFDFIPNLTALDYLRQILVFRGFTTRKHKHRIHEMLEKVRLEKVAKREAHRFSRGMKQRLMIAGAFLCPVQLVLLDEPTSGLDPKERVLFRDLLAEEATRRIVILSTHIVGDIERCCGRIGILASGELSYDGSPADLVQTVEEKVWEIETGEGTIDETGRELLVSSKSVKDGHIYSRVISSSQPAPDAKPMEPSLEDAYITLLSNKHQSSSSQAST